MTAPTPPDPQPAVIATAVEGRYTYAVTGAPDATEPTYRTSLRRPRTVRPERLIVHVRDGAVWYVQVVGPRVRRDGALGATCRPGWMRSGQHPPAWIADHLDREGFTWWGGDLG